MSIETRPNGLWPFTEMVLNAIEQAGGSVPKIEAHDLADESDFIWGELTPELKLTQGEYMIIDHEAGAYYVAFGTRGCCGGDPTFGQCLLMPTEENATMLAARFKDYFTR